MSQHKNGLSATNGSKKDTPDSQSTLPNPPPRPDPRLTPTSVRGNYPLESNEKPKR